MLELGLLGNMSRRICPSINDAEGIYTTDDRIIDNQCFLLDQRADSGCQTRFSYSSHANGEA